MKSLGTGILLMTVCFQVYGGILYVSKAGNDSDGLTWQSAFLAISDAVAAATSGDDIWVASGTYNESVDLPQAVSLFGGFLGIESTDQFSNRNWKSNETIIDASGLNDRCIGMHDVDGVILDGFILRNGYPRLNTYYGDEGGGIAVWRSHLQIKNCKIHDNVVGISPGPYYSSGGGIYMRDSVVEIENCEFLDNYAASLGGAIYANDFDPFFLTTLTIRSCFFEGNIGNAVTTTDTQLLVENCTFGLGNYSHSTREYHDLDSISRYGYETMTITNCIIRSHIRPWTEVTFSNVLEYEGEGNIDEDPRWVDPDNYDYRLKIDSPCIDSGTDVDLLIDVDGNPRPVDFRDRGIGRGFDMGAYEFQIKKSDLNQDGKVNAVDLTMFKDDWGEERSLNESP